MPPVARRRTSTSALAPPAGRRSAVSCSALPGARRPRACRRSPVPGLRLRRVRSTVASASWSARRRVSSSSACCSCASLRLSGPQLLPTAITTSPTAATWCASGTASGHGSARAPAGRRGAHGTARRAGSAGGGHGARASTCRAVIACSSRALKACSGVSSLPTDVSSTCACASSGSSTAGRPSSASHQPVSSVDSRARLRWCGFLPDIGAAGSWLRQRASARVNRAVLSASVVFVRVCCCSPAVSLPESGAGMQAAQTSYLMGRAQARRCSIAGGSSSALLDA